MNPTNEVGGTFRLGLHELHASATIHLFKHCGLGAEAELVPALESVDGFARQYAHVGGLEIERFGRGPVQPYDRVKRRWHSRR